METDPLVVWRRHTNAESVNGATLYNSVLNNFVNRNSEICEHFLRRFLLGKLF